MSTGTNNKRIATYLATGIILALLCSFFKVQAQQSNQTVVNGANTAAVNFGSGCTYNWTNSNPTIGLAASGTGDIAAFKAINNTNSPITATITATPDISGFAYIACYGTALGGYIDVINTTTDVKVRTIPINAYPQGITVSKNGDVVYTTNQNAGKNIKILTETNTVSPYTATGYGIALAPDENTYYYTSGSGSSLFAVNTITNNTAIINVGNNPYGVAVNSDGSRVYVANNGSNTVSVVNTVNNSVATIPIGLGFKPYGIAIAKTPNEELVYVTNSGNNTVTVFKGSNNGLLAVIPVGTQPVGVASSPDGAFVYVTNKGDNTVSVINTTANTVTKTITVGSNPVGVSVTPDGKKVYVANSGSSTVSVINTATNVLSVNVDVYNKPESFGNFIPKGDCQAVTFTITVNPTPTTATITTNGSLSALNTVYGTPSTAATFTVSGTTLTAGILVTPPSGFEVSIDDITFGNTITIPVGPGGKVSAVTVFIRLKANAGAGTYFGDVVLSTPGALNATIATNSSSIAKAQLNITATNANKPYGTPLTVVTGSTNFTWSGLQNGETIGSVTLTYGAGGSLNAALGTYPGSITPSAPTDGTFLVGNYTVNPFAGDLTVNKAPLIITADNKTRDFGAPDPIFTVTYSGFASNEGAAQLTTQPVATTTATINSLPGQYAITVTGASAINYTITYVPGIFTINPVVQPITVPNAFTPNNDGINDTWEIKYLASSYPNCTVEVFNRYNERVYFSNGYAVAWNGEYMGTNLPFGTYYYVINTHTNIKSFAGYLTIIR
ncbi:MBG domain-containing protein [Mucilaginibacter sp. UYCu711]|uniref:MBG domain-containing protein n=1 Tax=Mucilaginibacter sp. UYCu711 TaxID=3156339 RepID=UPI003D1D5B4F